MSALQTRAIPDQPLQLKRLMTIELLADAWDPGAMLVGWVNKWESEFQPAKPRALRVRFVEDYNMLEFTFTF